MIDLEDYRLAWQAYVGCGILATVLWFFLLRRVPMVFLRFWLLFAAIAFLFTPSRHPQMSELWVPASVGSVLALMTDGIEVAMPILLTLAIGQILAVVLAISLWMWWPKLRGEASEATEGTPLKPKARTNSVERREPTMEIDEGNTGG